MSARPRMRALLTALTLLGVAGPPARAQEGRTVAVVVDRSGSLRHADPEARGPRLLAAALALALDPQDRLLLVADPAGQDPPEAPPDLGALAARLADLVSGAAPGRGGADVGALVASAAARVGQGGLVLVYTDDDLDVVGAGGDVPEEVVERARRAERRPARDALNRAALELVVERVRALPGRRLLGLRAPLPPGARTVPLLEAVGARVLELAGPEDALLADLVEAVRGEPALSQAEAIPADGALELPGPARVVLHGEAPLSLPGAHPLDAEGRTVILDAPRGPLRPGVPARSWVAPRAPLPSQVRAFALRGAARVVVPGEDPHREAGQLVLRWGARQVPLEGSPLQAQLPPAAGPLTLLRVVQGTGGRQAVAASRELFPQLAEVELGTSGPATTGLPQELSGSPPAELAWKEPIALRLRGPGGRVERVVLVDAGEGRFSGRFTPPAEGTWEAQAEGLLPVRLSAPLEVAPGARYRLRIEELAGPDGQPLFELWPEAPRVALRIRMAVEPPLPAAVPLQVTLNDAPPGAEVALEGGLSLQDRAEGSLVLTWPEDATGDARVLLRVRGPEGSALAATHGFLVHPRRSLTRLLAASGLLSLAVVLTVVQVVRRRRARAAALAAAAVDAEEELDDEELEAPAPRRHALPPEAASRLGTRQLRGLGTNGKISVERYGFLEHSREDSSVVISPEDSSVSVELHVRDDGTVKAKAVEGAKLIHEDRPELLVNETTLRHGNAFAVVEGPRARRYVYLDREPDADELQTRFVEGTVSNEAEMRDSGMFVVLDDHHEVAPESARLVGVGPGLLGRSGEDDDQDEGEDSDLSEDEEEDEDEDSDLGEEIEDSADQAVLIDDEPGERPPVSDEGVVYMDSDESEILDSDEQERVPTDQGAVGPDDPTGEAPALPAAPPARELASGEVIGGSAWDVAGPGDPDQA